jgi:hypothetical protein
MFQCEHAMNVNIFDFELVEELKPQCKTITLYRNRSLLVVNLCQGELVFLSEAND